MPLRNSAHYLLNDYLKKYSLNRSIDHFRQSTKHYQIWLIILDYYFQKKQISIEQVVRITKHISLKTISAIISDAEKLGYLSRVKFTNDARKKNIIPTAETVKDYPSWVESMSSNLRICIKK